MEERDKAMRGTEVIDKGFASIANLLQELDLVVDTMQEEDVPVRRISTYIYAQVKTILDKAGEKQNARWYKDPDQESMDLEIDHITLSSGQTLHVAITDDGGVK